MSILDHIWGESPAADRVWAQFAGMRPSLIPRLRLMVLQAYMDDSRDDASGTYVLAGYIASVEQWAAFSRDWEALLPLATKNKNGECRFKMSEMARAGKMEDVALFRNVIMKHAQMGIAIIINTKALRSKVDNLVAAVPIPEAGIEIEIEIEALKAKWRDPFFFCFRALLDTIPELQTEKSELVPVDGVVDFWFDKEEANEIYVRSIWDEYLARREPEYRPLYGAKPRFERDEDFPPLQAADFWAWWVRKWTLEFGPEGIQEGQYPFDPGDKKMFYLTLTATEEQISTTVAKSIGAALEEFVQRGNPLPAKQPPLPRFWPRDPL